MGALIDEWLPTYEYSEDHRVVVDAPPAAAWASLRSGDLSSSIAVRVLLAVRGMPPRHLGIDTLTGFGFVILEELPGREIVLGLVGRFWRPRGGLVRMTAPEFRIFDRPGYAKAVWNFIVEAGEAHRSVVSTSTRVHCTDARSRRRFGRYWRFVGPFSGYIRTRMLRSIKRGSERANASAWPSS